jgi:DNA-binding transcriptional LysR family regulator
MDIASDMLLFVHAVDHGSFSATARALALTPSAVSKRIGRLEDRLGVRLLNRSTRRTTLTEAGEALYRRCARIAAEISEAEALAASMGEQVRGTLTVASTVAFGKAQLMPLIPEFLARHPELKLSLELTDRAVDLAQDQLDVAIRFTEQVSDAAVVARKLASNRRVICAAPSYLERHGTPARPDDLLRHNCLRLSTVPLWNDWELGEGKAKRVYRVKGSLEVNSADAVYHAALAGLGIARLSSYLVGPDIRAGRLVRLLPAYCQEDSSILAIYLDRRNLPAKVRAFIDFLAERLGPVPPWEREANAA